MDWVAIGINALVAVGVGLLLWTFLPRGVVLTRTPRTKDFRGESLYDTWEVRNSGPLPIRIRSVRFSDVMTVDLDAHEVRQVELPAEGLPSHDISLTFDEEMNEISREEWQTPWSQVVVEPGDSLLAHVPNNASLYIDYRRAGLSGILERRNITIHGGV
jgi:hypothetical protein